ncbi:AbrB family transcriptional regulator [Morganella morganii]|uniref:AbrB family transcriptional regulator n=1 Tax=Morganella morganii TaxID=582 RepID=UPI001BD91624|nr:AbrB family transcriptional regulator [Morganella morganii]EGT3608508.1 AbrB family transcriptional regulator [Morganella morganii]MBT0374130.1 AbrB family transcriptional regulator [Morganella morganii subsp. morganii]HDU8624180.1 AbrB family transcriptional regulator [Morganella morganii]
MNIIKIAAGISACFAAGLLLAYLNVPMALMFGPIILIIIAHRFNVSLTIPKGTLTFVQMVLGTSVGLMFTRVDLSQFDHLLLIMLIMVSCLAVQFTVSFLWFRKRVGWSVQESLLGAVPGAMAAILALMDHTGTPPQKVVISHTIRLIILIMLAGVVVGSDHPVPPPADIPPQSLVSVLWLLVIVVCGYLSGKALEKINVPAPFMLTSLGTAIAVQSMVSTYIVFPLPLNDISMTLIGMYIGSYFVLFPLRSLLHNMVTSAQVVLINIVLTALIAFGASHLTGFSFPMLLLSWAPGSMEAMTFAAIAMGIDAGFVMLNHILRMLIIQSVPSMVLYIQERRSK